MNTIIHKPTKEAVRRYTQQRSIIRTKPDSGEKIRRMLGWYIKASQTGVYHG